MKTSISKFSGILPVLGLCLTLGFFIHACGGSQEGPCGQFECQNGGELHVGNGYCACSCPPDFVGEQCETPI